LQLAACSRPPRPLSVPLCAGRTSQQDLGPLDAHRLHEWHVCTATEAKYKTGAHGAHFWCLV
jgi:hypothetical protein